jgi:hypothetical protein
MDYDPKRKRSKEAESLITITLVTKYFAVWMTHCHINKQWSQSKHSGYLRCAYIFLLSELSVVASIMAMYLKGEKLIK